MMDLPNNSQTLQAAMNLAQENQLLNDGDLVVITAGTLQGVAGSTDLIKVEVVKSILGKGVGIGQGAASGRARVARYAREVTQFNQGEILVVPSTNAEYVEMMRHAGGIITEEDTPSSHAATIGLRLGIPVIVGVKNATTLIRDGVIISLDAQRGLVFTGMTSGILNNNGRSLRK
jgi:pyruvate kinase